MMGFRLSLENLSPDTGLQEAPLPGLHGITEQVLTALSMGQMRDFFLVSKGHRPLGWGRQTHLALLKTPPPPRLPCGCSLRLAPAASLWGRGGGS